MNKKTIEALEKVIDHALECSCSCGGPGTGRGYLNHDRGCWVHILREDYKLALGFIAKAKQPDQAASPDPACPLCLGKGVTTVHGSLCSCVRTTAHKCERCGHGWTPRQSRIRICPKCKSPYWDVPKQKKATP